MKKDIIILLLIAIAFSCNPTKRLEKKQERAWDVFVTNPTLIKRSVPLVAALYPCVVKNEIVRLDTSFIYSTDTLLVKVPTIKNRVLDTIISDISVFEDSTGLYVKYLGKAKVITKTIEITKVDSSAVNRGIDTIHAKEVLISSLNGQIIEKDKRIESEHKDANSWQMKFWGLLALIVSINIILLYVKFKSKVPLIP